MTRPCSHYTNESVVLYLQALLTGLTVMTPRDPWKFVSQSLAQILATNITIIPRYGSGGGILLHFSLHSVLCIGISLWTLHPALSCREAHFALFSLTLTPLTKSS